MAAYLNNILKLSILCLNNNSPESSNHAYLMRQCIKQIDADQMLRDKDYQIHYILYSLIGLVLLIQKIICHATYRNCLHKLNKQQNVNIRFKN